MCKCVLGSSEGLQEEEEEGGSVIGREGCEGEAAATRKTEKRGRRKTQPRK